MQYAIYNTGTAFPLISEVKRQQRLTIANILQDSATESQQLLLSAELYGQYVSLALRSEAVDSGDMTEITLVRQFIGMST